MSVIYLIRHGQSEANLKRIWGGNFPLTEKGKEQAAHVRKKLEKEPDKIVCSMLQRVAQTAQIAFPCESIEKNGLFNEIGFGDVELLEMTEETIKMYHDDPEGFQEKYHGENMNERAQKAIKEIERYAKENEVTAIFLSNTLLKCILTILQEKSFADTKAYYVKNCEVITLSYDGKLNIEDWSAVQFI